MPGGERVARLGETTGAIYAAQLRGELCAASSPRVEVMLGEELQVVGSQGPAWCPQRENGLLCGGDVSLGGFSW